MLFESFKQVLTIFLCFLFWECSGQNFESYTDIRTGSPPEFSCNNNQKERIFLRDPCGSIISPCYPGMNYPVDIVSGIKVWDLDANNGSTTVVAYRFTIEDFETNPNGGFLDFNPNITYDASIDLNQFSNGRQLSLSGSASTPPGVVFNFLNEPNQFQMENESFTLNATRYYLIFDSSRIATDRGFNISYCADYDLCNTSLICETPEGGVCIRNGFQSYSCICNPGFNGSNCVDVDECTSNPCDSNAFCQNSLGSFTCTCNVQYFGNGFTCTNVNECLQTPNIYDVNATCINTIGNFTCFCNPRYTGDGVTCAYIDECATNTNNCDQNAICNDTEGSFTCTCNGGFTGDGVTCTDVDECETSRNNCVSNSTCLNTLGGFLCVCNDGFTGNGTFCQPFLEITNLQVTSQSNETNSYFSLTFDGTPQWINNSLYVLNYNISIFATSSTAAISPLSAPRSITTRNVNETDFLPVVIEATPGEVSYEIEISIGDVGPEFNNLVLVFDSSGRSRNVLSASIAPLPVGSFTATVLSDVIVITSWDPPLEINIGPTTQYEVGYQRTQTDCDSFAPLGLNITDCSEESLIRFPAVGTSYALYGLQRYRDYKVRIRAYTSFGPGPWTVSLLFFSGFSCPSQLSLIEASNFSCDYNQASISSSGFPNPYGNMTDFWEIAFDGGIRFSIDYFSTELNIDLVEFELVQTQDSASTSGLPVNQTLSGFLGRDFPPVEFIGNSEGNSSVRVRFSSDDAGFDPGFLIYYVTNDTQCINNPCQNGGNCSSFFFTFTCACTPEWGGTICNIPRVEFVSSSCVGISSNSVRITWSVTSQWFGNPTLITRYNVLGLPIRVNRGRRSTSYNALGFSPYEEVNVTLNVQLANPDVITSPSTFSCRTLEAPSSALGFLEISSLNSTSISVNWTAPTFENGVISGYRIDYTQIDANEFGETPDAGFIDVGLVLNTVLNNLRPFRTYRVYVAAINGAGLGNISSATVQTQEGVPIEPVRNLMGTSFARSINLTFMQPETITGNFEYNVTYMPGSGSATGTTSPITISNLTPATSYTFTVTPSTAAGIGDSSTEANTTVTTLEDVPGQVSNLILNSDSSTSIVATWSPPMQPNGAITQYRVSWVPSTGGISMGMNVTGLTLAIPGLSVFSMYNVSVSAFTAIGEGMSTSGMARTQAGFSGVPASITALSPTSTSIRVNWTPPNSANGVISGYRINYTQTDANEFGETADAGFIDVGLVSTTLLNNLRPFRIYRVTVGAINGAGVGDISSATVQTQEGAPVGPVRNLVGMPTARSINLTFIQPETITGNFEYNVTYMLGSGNASGTTSPITFSNLIPATSYTFTVTPLTAAGFGDASTEASTTVTTLEDVPGQVSNLILNPDSSMSIVATWSPPMQPNGAITQYRVSWVLSTGGTSMRMNVAGLTFTIPGLSAFSMYNVSVSAFTAIGEGMSTSGMARTQAGFAGVPDSVTALSPNSTSIRVNWTPPNSANGVIFGYRIGYTQRDANEFGETADAGFIDVGLVLTTLLNNLRPFRIYRATVGAINGAGVGDISSATVQTQEGAPVGPVRNLVGMPTARSITLAFMQPETITGNFEYNVTYMPGSGSASGTTSPITISNLTPATLYTLTVTPLTAVGIDDALTEANTTVTTLDDIPGQVSNLILNSNSSTSIVATWSPPMQPNGAIIQYRISWVPSFGGTTMSMTVLTTSFTISNLSAFTMYTVSVSAFTAIGEGMNISGISMTEAGAPSEPLNLEIVVNSDNTFTITFDEPTSPNGILLFYSIRILQNISQCQFHNDSSCIDITTEIPANQNRTYTTPTLQTFRMYLVSVQANNSEGSSPPSQASVETAENSPPGPVTNVVVMNNFGTVDVAWTASLPLSSPVSYEVLATPLAFQNNSALLSIQNSSMVNLQVSFFDLNEELGYTVTIVPSNQFGAGPQVEAILNRVPIPLSTSDPESSLNTIPNLQGASPTYAFNIRNPCMYVTQLFEPFRGNIDIILIIVKEVSASETTIPDVWLNSINENPIPPYVAGSVQCITSTNRKKRSLTPDEEDYTIGLNTSCLSAGMTICNGELRSGLTYDVAFLAINNAGISNLTSYGATTETSSTQQPAPSVISGALPQPYQGEQNLQGLSAARARVIENPCVNSERYFVGGAIAIEVLIKETDFTSQIFEPLVWVDAIVQTPIPPYVTALLNCEGGRNKRQLSTNNAGFLVGANANCSRINSTLCNGPLEPNRSYQVAYRASNGGNDVSNITSFGADFSTQLSRPESCRARSLSLNGSSYSFNETLPQLLAYSNEKCENGIPLASILCNDSTTPTVFQFDSTTLFIATCTNRSVNEIVENIDTNSITTEQLEETLSEIDVTISIAEDMSVDDAISAVSFLSSVSENIENIQISTTSFSRVLNIADHVSDIIEQDPGSQRTIDMEGSLVESLVSFGTQLNLENVENAIISFLTPNIAAEISDRGVDENIFYQPEVYANDLGDIIQPITVFIPSEAVMRASEISSESTNKRKRRNTDGDTMVRAVNMIQRRSLLFPSNEMAEWVVSSDLNNQRIRDLNESVRIIHNTVTMEGGRTPNSLNQFEDVFVNETCSFWDFETNSWSTEGCCLVRGSNPPECRCNHLTNYALLLSVYPLPRNVALATVTLVGTILSIIFLLVTIILLLITLKNIKPSPSTSHKASYSKNVYLNICANLTFVYIIFLAGISKRDDINQCITATVFLHYFLLTTWMWMAMFAQDLYKSVVMIWSAVSSHYLLKSYIFAYSVPAVIVILNAAISLPLSTSPNMPPICGEEPQHIQAVSAMLGPNMCWLHGYSLYFSFVLPVGIILLFNVIVFILVIRKLTWKRKKISSTQIKNTLKQDFIRAVTISCFLGLVWLLGYFMLFSSNITYLTVISWIFTIAVTFQGFGMFFLLCVRNTEVKNQWWPTVLRLLLYIRLGGVVRTQDYTSTSSTAFERSTKIQSTTEKL